MTQTCVSGGLLLSAHDLHPVHLPLYLSPRWYAAFSQYIDFEPFAVIVTPPLGWEGHSPSQSAQHRDLGRPQMVIGHAASCRSCSKRLGTGVSHEEDIANSIYIFLCPARRSGRGSQMALKVWLTCGREEYSPHKILPWMHAGSERCPS